jgi:ATP-binding cassette subfamily C protein
MTSLIAETMAEKEVISGGSFPTLEKSIRLDGVTFNRGTKPILKNASMQVPAGRLTMLVGPTGSGKTTTADLIIGLIRPEAGEVWVDSAPLHDLDMKAWRSMVGYVPQELFLFHDTILRNVTLGDPKFSSEEAEAVLRVTGAWEFVAALPEGIHSVVGERGAKLSGGQRQRIAMARALIRKPKLLILDEATSGLDSGAEESLFMSLRSLSEPLTIFAISHRSSFSNIADILYGIEAGEIKPLKKGPENRSML